MTPEPQSTFGMLRAVNQSLLLLLNIDKPLEERRRSLFIGDEALRHQAEAFGGSLAPDCGCSRLVSSEVASIQVAAKEMPEATCVRCPLCSLEEKKEAEASLGEVFSRPPCVVRSALNQTLLSHVC